MDSSIAWAGGKRQLLEDIKKLLPEELGSDSYHEPMVGGGAVFFGLEPSSGTINDVNEDLITFYKAIKKDPEKVINLAQNHKQTEEYYYKKREEYNRNNLGLFEKAALFLYFNKAAYNSLWRVNTKGEFNVPYGDPKEFEPEKIRKSSNILKNIKIKNEDFEYILQEASRGDKVYFDPPYPSTPNSPNYNKYTVEEFDMEDQKRLLKCCLELDRKGVFFVLSNADTEEIRQLLSSFEHKFSLIEIGARRWISCRSSSMEDELLITNVPEEKWSKSKG